MEGEKMQEETPETCTNSIGMKFVLIPAGEFMMGSPESERYGSEGYSNEGPVHRVKISRPFYLGIYPVTQREWEQIIGNSGSKTHEVGQKKPNPWGLYDMHGNVEEWVQDSWYGNYNGAPTDGSAWERLFGRSCFFRGSSWHRSAWGCWSAIRYGSGLGSRFPNLGFRLLRTP